MCKSAFFDAVDWTGVLFACSMFNTSFTCVVSVDHPLHILILLSVCRSPATLWGVPTVECLSLAVQTWIRVHLLPDLKDFKLVRILRYFEQSVMRDCMKRPSSGWSGSVACQDFLYRT